MPLKKILPASWVAKLAPVNYTRNSSTVSSGNPFMVLTLFFPPLALLSTGWIAHRFYSFFFADPSLSLLTNLPTTLAIFGITAFTGGIFFLAWLRSGQTRALGAFFHDTLAGVEADIMKAHDRLQELNLPEGSEPGRLIRATHAALESAASVAVQLHEEVIFYSPNLKAELDQAEKALVDRRKYKVSSVYSRALNAEDFPEELRLQVSEFIDSLKVFEDFNEHFEKLVSLSLKSKLRVPDISSFTSAADTLRSKFSEAALSSELDAAARQELNAFVAEKFEDPQDTLNLKPASKGNSREDRVLGFRGDLA